MGGSMQLMVLAGLVLLQTTFVPGKSKGLTSCSPYIYCVGKKFPSQITVKHRSVSCDSVPDPLNRCCMASANHMVCYNIMVDGQYLNYAPNNNLDDTNFTDLCRELLKTQGKELGTQTSTSKEPGGGTLAYRYDKWIGTKSGSEHIKDIACQVLE